MREDYVGSPYDDEVFSTLNGDIHNWYDEPGFGLDMEAGHGTHTAGSAAGSTLASPAETVTCGAGSEVSCTGKCLTTAEAADAAADNLLTWDTLCPQYNCDGGSGEACLSEDVPETLADNGGIARGAKVAVFDVSVDGSAVWASLAANGLWNATEGTGCMLHSNSWGGDFDCNIDSETASYDQYMYEVSGRTAAVGPHARRGGGRHNFMLWKRGARFSSSPFLLDLYTAQLLFFSNAEVGEVETVFWASQRSQISRNMNTSCVHENHNGMEERL